MRGLILGLALSTCLPARAFAQAGGPVVIEITAKKFEYHPSRILLKRGVPVILKLRTLDRRHGFKAPGLGLVAELKPGVPVELHLTPEKAGTFPFACHLFCGSGHDDMSGEIVVED